MHWIWIKLNFHLTLHKRNTDSNIFMSIYLKMRVSLIYQLCQSMPGTRQGQAGTRQGQTGPRQGETGKNRTNQDSPFISCLSLSVPVCLCLSMSVPVGPCLPLSVPVCPCLSLYISTIAIPAFSPADYHRLHQNEHTKIDFAWKATAPMHSNPLFNFISLLYF